jgi:hypothetical protein
MSTTGRIASILALPTLSLVAAPVAFAGKQPPNTIWVDGDGDGVHDSVDVCPGSDDTVDLDGNDSPDCAQTWVEGGTFDSTDDLDHWDEWMPWTHGSTWGLLPDDGNGFASSDSVQLYLAAPYANHGHISSTCIAVPASTRIQLMSQFWLVSTDLDESPRGSLQLWQYDSLANCNANMGMLVTIVDSHAGNLSGFGVWGARFTSEPNTQYARVIIYAQSPEDVDSPAPFHLRVDNILLSEADPDLDPVDDPMD